MNDPDDTEATADEMDVDIGGGAYDDKIDGADDDGEDSANEGGDEKSDEDGEEEEDEEDEDELDEDGEEEEDEDTEVEEDEDTEEDEEEQEHGEEVEYKDEVQVSDRSSDESAKSTDGEQQSGSDESASDTGDAGTGPDAVDSPLLLVSELEGSDTNGSDYPEEYCSKHGDEYDKELVSASKKFDFHVRFQMEDGMPANLMIEVKEGDTLRNLWESILRRVQVDHSWSFDVQYDNVIKNISGTLFATPEHGGGVVGVSGFEWWSVKLEELKDETDMVVLVNQKCGESWHGKPNLMAEVAMSTAEGELSECIWRD